MAGGEHEAVAVEPVRVRRVVLHLVRVELVGHGRQRHRRARVAGVGLLHPVHREGADGVDRQRLRCVISLPRRSSLARSISVLSSSCAASTPAPITPASAPPRASLTRGALPQRGQRVARRLRARGVEEQVAPPATARRRSPRARARRCSPRSRCPARASGRSARTRASIVSSPALRRLHRLASRTPRVARPPRWRARSRPVPLQIHSSDPGRGKPGSRRRPARSRRRGSRGPSPPRARWPRSIRPSITMPPPTPVPSVSITRCCAGGSGTSWASASAAQLASLSTNTGTPNRLPSSSRSGTPSSGMFTLESTVPVANSTCDGTPMPDRVRRRRPTSATRRGDPVEQRLRAGQVGGVLDRVAAPARPRSARRRPWCPPRRCRARRLTRGILPASMAGCNAGHGSPSPPRSRPRASTAAAALPAGETENARPAAPAGPARAARAARARRCGCSTRARWACPRTAGWCAACGCLRGASTSPPGTRSCGAPPTAGGGATATTTWSACCCGWRAATRRADPEPPLPMLVGDLSRPRGGEFGRRFGALGHSSHQNGLDADVYYPRRDRRPAPPRTVRAGGHPPRAAAGGPVRGRRGEDGAGGAHTCR